MMELTQERRAHIYAVATKMAKMAERDPERYGLTPEQAFTLGWLHDIGYAFCPGNHEAAGGSHMGISGYVFANEIYYHGNPDPPANYDTPQLRLLQYCDMTTGPNGEEMTLEERATDIAKRYGDTSPQAFNATKMLARLKEKGEKNA